MCGAVLEEIASVSAAIRRVATGVEAAIQALASAGFTALDALPRLVAAVQAAERDVLSDLAAAVLVAAGLAAARIRLAGEFPTSGPARVGPVMTALETTGEGVTRQLLAALLAPTAVKALLEHGAGALGTLGAAVDEVAGRLLAGRRLVDRRDRDGRHDRRPLARGWFGRRGGGAGSDAGEKECNDQTDCLHLFISFARRDRGRALSDWTGEGRDGCGTCAERRDSCLVLRAWTCRPGSAD
jgi:hypothetical protein